MTQNKSCCSIEKPKKEVSYKPIIHIFSLTFLMSLAMSWTIWGSFEAIKIVEFFMGFSVCALAVLKFRDIESFSLQFSSYDLLAQKWGKYGYVYPYAEAFVGLGMIAMILAPIAAPIALFTGTLGAFSVFKAVYIEKKDLQCACVGGSSKVPLGFVSLTENIMMMAMGVWMLLQL